MVASIINVDGKYLITKRLANSHFAGYWEFPGGKVKENESYADALKRELLEEIGLTVSVGSLLQHISYEYSDRIIDLRFYESTILSGEPKAIECEEINWISSSEFINYEFLPADSKILNLLSEK